MDRHTVQGVVTSVVHRPGGEGAHAVERLPDGRALILLRLGAATDLSFGGPLSRAVYKRAPAAPRTVAVKLAPGAASRLVGEVLDELVDSIVPLASLWGTAADELLERAIERPHDAPRLVLDAVEARLRGARDERSAATLTRLAIRRVDADPTGWTVASLAGALGVTPRHLRRTFTPCVGVAPKRYLRMRRLRSALARATEEPRRGWSEVAFDAGYVDQAHLIRECRALYGMSPGAFLRRRDSPSGPALRDC